MSRSLRVNCTVHVSFDSHFHAVIDLLSHVVSWFEMGKQEFKMTAHIRTVYDISWTKFLLLLPKFSYTKIYKRPKDCGNMEIGDNRNGVFTEIINNLKLEK